MRGPSLRIPLITVTLITLGLAAYNILHAPATWFASAAICALAWFGGYLASRVE